MKVQTQILGVFAEGRRQSQEVASTAEASGIDIRRLITRAGDVGIARQGPTSVLFGEVLQQFDIGCKFVDHNAQRLRTAGLGRRLQHGTADQADLVGGDFVGMETTENERQIGPVHADIGGFQPHAIHVRHRDAVQGKVVEQIAAQALDIDLAVTTDLFAGHKGGDQFAACIRHQIVAPAHHGHDPEADQRPDADPRKDGDRF